MSKPTQRPWTANLDSDHGDFTIWGPGEHDSIANVGTAPEDNGIVAFDVSRENALLLVAAVNELETVYQAVRDLMADPSWVILTNHGWETLKAWTERYGRLREGA